MPELLKNLHFLPFYWPKQVTELNLELKYESGCSTPLILHKVLQSHLKNGSDVESSEELGPFA